MHILGNLKAKQLAVLATVSKAMMCFANHEGLWKALTIEASQSIQAAVLGLTTCTKSIQKHSPYHRNHIEDDPTPQAELNFRFSRCWRQTYMRSCESGQKHFKVAQRIHACGMFSDFLYSSWHFAHAELEEQWLEGDSIPRVAAADLSKERFLQDFERPNRPVIITGLVCAYPTHILNANHMSYVYNARVTTCKQYSMSNSVRHGTYNA